MRIYELSKKINIGNKEIIAKLAELDMTVKSHLSSIDKDTANKLTDMFHQKVKQKSILSEKEESPIKEMDEVIVPEYIKFFGLKKLPFENVPDPVFFFDEGDYARIHNRIKYSLKAGRGLTVVTGPIGSGKTTLSQMVISEFSHDIKLIWMAEPPGSSMNLFLFICQELDLKPASSKRAFVLRDIRMALLKINKEGNKCLLIIDESHLMKDDTLDGIRMLNNLEEGSAKLIQVLLLGQEEIIETINKPEMEPFKQRIASLEIIGKMDSERIREYVSHRLKVAGGQPSLFEDTGWEALGLVFGSGGTPRIVNSLCDRSLNAAFEREKIVVDVDDVYEAAHGMGLQKEIFFYKISLKKEQALHAGDNNFVKDPEKLSNGPIPSFNHKSEGIETFQSPQKGSEIGFYLSEKNQKGLKTPILFLLLSIVVLIIIIFFLLFYYA